MKLMAVLLSGAVALSFGASAFAQSSDKALKAAVDARKAHMSLYSFNLGALGAMASGDMPYDAAAAQAAADNLAALSALNQSGYWLPGTDSDVYEGSRALPATWAADSKAMQMGMDLAAATAAMQQVAGTDLAGLQGGMKAIGDACSACHESYRKPRS